MGRWWWWGGGFLGQRSFTASNRCFVCLLCASWPLWCRTFQPGATHKSAFQGPFLSLCFAFVHNPLPRGAATYLWQCVTYRFIPRMVSVWAPIWSHIPMTLTVEPARRINLRSTLPLWRAEGNARVCRSDWQTSLCLLITISLPVHDLLCRPRWTPLCLSLIGTIYVLHSFFYGSHICTDFTFIFHVDPIQSIGC